MPDNVPKRWGFPDKLPRAAFLDNGSCQPHHRLLSEFPTGWSMHQGHEQTFLRAVVIPPEVPGMLNAVPGSRGVRDGCAQEPRGLLDSTRRQRIAATASPATTVTNHRPGRVTAGSQGLSA